jgi:hypothetical protein
MSTDLTEAQARDLTPEEQQELAERAYELQEAVKAGLRAGREALWSLAKALHEIDEVRGWAALGYDTLGEWLADSEIGITRRTYFRLVKTYRGLVVRRSVSATSLQRLDPSKVDIVLPKVEKGDVLLEDALADVEAMPARDLREKYVGHRRSEPETIEGTAKDVDAGATESAPDDLDIPDGDQDPSDVEMTPEEALADARDNWEQLRAVLMDALASGGPNPRIPANVIQPGITGVEELLEARDGGGD